MNEGFREFVEEVRRRNDIVQVVGAEVDLRQNGTGLKGLSPFNPETNPSFVVWPESQRWRDYSKGGGRGGDVFDYVMDRKACTFKEALDELAGRVGVKRPNQDDAEYARELALITERVEIERLFTRAAAYYHRVLPSKIREELYHQHYGFKDETIDTLQLGWADGHLYDYLHDRFGIRRTEAFKRSGTERPLGRCHRADAQAAASRRNCCRLIRMRATPVWSLPGGMGQETRNHGSNAEAVPAPSLPSASLER